VYGRECGQDFSGNRLGIGENEPSSVAKVNNLKLFKILGDRSRCA